MEIYILDKQLNILGVFSTYEALIWNPKLSEPGTFKASFIFSDRMNKLLKRGNLIYRTDEVEPAIITRKFLELKRNGTETIQVQGYMASRYLEQRIIWGKTILQGTPEEVMRTLVYNNVVNPENTARKIPTITLGDLHGYEGAIQKQVTYDNLQVTLTDICKTSELGYRLILDLEQKMFFFDIIQGTNRTSESDTPCIFSRDFNNIYEQKYSEDSTNYKNVCLIGGIGEDEERILETIGEESGLERHELFVNASSLSNKDVTAEEYLEQLKQKGSEVLAKFYIATAFESKINQGRTMKYNLGDYVTYRDKRWGLQLDTQIKEITEGFSKTEKSSFVTFGDNVPTLIDLIKAKEN